MSTPADEKRKARLAARKANLANTQAARRPLGDDAEEVSSGMDETTTDEGSLAAAESLPEATAPDQPMAVESDALVAAPADAPPPIVAATEDAAPVTPAQPAVPMRTTNGTTITKTGSGATVAGSRTTSRPIPGGATVGRTPTRPTGGKSPSRPLTGGATVGKSTAPSTGKSLTTPTASSKLPSRPLAAATAGASARVTGAGASFRPPTHEEATETEEAANKTKRDLRRETRMADLARVQAERKRALAQKKMQTRIRTWGTVAAIALVVVLLGVLFYNLTGGNTSSTAIKSGYGANITCGQEVTAVHYHSNIQIYVNGKNEPIPAGVGFSTDATASPCLYWIHTHRPDGVVHMEAPAESATRKFMVGDLFAIWKLTQNPSNTLAAGPPQLSSTQFFGLPVDKQHPLTVYVDPTGSGNFTVYTGDPNKIVMTSHENIWFEYGTTLVKPVAFNWTGTGE